MSPDFPIIVADESVDKRIILALKDAGYNIFSIVEESSGISDAKVIEIAMNMHAFLITEDKDFGDELVYKKEAHLSSLLIRLGDIPIKERIRLIIDTLHTNAKELQGSFSVLTAKKLRIRKYSNR